MPKKLLVDYHFHPNLSKQDGRAKKKCERIWEMFATKGVDAAVITEHVFKNPSRAFTLLQATRPTNAKTIIFPGIEGLSKEGVDVICFAETTSIYEHTKLMVPRQLSVEEMVEYVQAHSELHMSLPHPYGPGHSSLMRQLGEAEGLRIIKKLGAVEVSNACFRGAKRVLNFFRLNTLIPKKRKCMDMTSYLPREIYQGLDIQLFTGGSDAHVLVEIGSGLCVPHNGPWNSQAIFHTICHNVSTEFEETDSKIFFWLGVYKLYSVIVESFTKAFRLYEGKIYQHDDQFTNFYSEAEKEAVIAIRKQRGRLLKPLLNFLTYFGITPNILNGVSFVTAPTSFIVALSRPLLSSILFLIYLGSSGITSALALYQQSESESGAIMKIIRQYFALFTAVLAAIWFGWVDSFWAALYLGLYTIFLWLIITLNQIGHPIRFAIRSKLFVIAAIFLYVLAHVNIIDYLLIGFSLYMAITNAWMLFKLKRAATQGSTLQHRNKE